MTFRGTERTILGRSIFRRIMIYATPEIGFALTSLSRSALCCLRVPAHGIPAKRITKGTHSRLVDEEPGNGGMVDHAPTDIVLSAFVVRPRRSLIAALPPAPDRPGAGGLPFGLRPQPPTVTVCCRVRCADLVRTADPTRHTRRKIALTVARGPNGDGIDRTVPARRWPSNRRGAGRRSREIGLRCGRQPQLPWPGRGRSSGPRCRGPRMSCNGTITVSATEAAPGGSCPSGSPRRPCRGSGGRTPARPSICSRRCVVVDVVGREPADGRVVVVRAGVGDAVVDVAVAAGSSRPGVVAEGELEDPHPGQVEPVAQRLDLGGDRRPGPRRSSGRPPSPSRSASRNAVARARHPRARSRPSGRRRGPPSRPRTPGNGRAGPGRPGRQSPSAGRSTRRTPPPRAPPSGRAGCPRAGRLR